MDQDSDTTQPTIYAAKGTQSNCRQCQLIIQGAAFMSNLQVRVERVITHEMNNSPIVKTQSTNILPIQTFQLLAFVQG